VKSRLLVTVFWRREEWLVRFKNCFGSSSLDRGQSRVPLEIIEVQNGEYTGEDDIVRIEDDYRR